MASPVTAPAVHATGSLLDQKMAKSSPGKWGIILFLIMLVGGLFYIISQLSNDLSVVHQASVYPYILLGLALFIALGFEFVNGFHDTANAVATCIYTHSLEPHVAVVYSGIMNFTGVLFSSGAVAFSIITLLPVELILKVSKGSGFSMVFALLAAAILWNLATWWRGLPASSSHTMIGSIIGVGVANQLMQGNPGTSGVEWEQVTKVFKALLLSPVIGFAMAALLFLLFKLVARDPRLYKAPEGSAPPPFYIRLLLIGTCGGVSYFHGSNDGQKGMGLIMLILVGTVPTAYALNHTVTASQVQTFAAVSGDLAGALAYYETPGVAIQDPPVRARKIRRQQDLRAWRHAWPPADDQRHPQPGHQLWLSCQGPAKHAGQRPQRDVPHQRNPSHPAQDERPQILGRRRQEDRQL